MDMHVVANYGSFGGLDDEERSSYLSHVVWYVEDGLMCVDRPHPQVNDPTHRLLHRLHSKCHYLRGLCLFLLIFLPFFEVPRWCPNHGCGDPALSSTPLTWASWHLWSQHTQHLLDLILMSFLFSQILLQRWFLGQHFHLRTDRNMALGITLFSLICLIWMIYYHEGRPSDSTSLMFMIYPYSRILILMTFHRPVRQAFRHIGRIVAEIYPSFMLLVVFVMTLSYIAMILFANTSEGEEVFPTFVESMWQIFLLITTVNFPDVMMPIYTQYRLSCLFFVFALVSGLFFLLNFILVEIIATYEHLQQANVTSKAETRNQKLRRAFDLLILCQAREEGREGLNWETFERLMTQLNDSPNQRLRERIPAKDMIRIFSKLDVSQTRRISRLEFLALFDVMDAVAHEECLSSPTTSCSRIQHRWNHRMIDVLVVFMTLLVLTYVHESPVLRNIILSCVYLMDLWITYYYYSTSSGIHTLWTHHRFDVCITLAQVMGTITLAVLVSLHYPASTATVANTTGSPTDANRRTRVSGLGLTLSSLALLSCLVRLGRQVSKLRRLLLICSRVFGFTISGHHHQYHHHPSTFGLLLPTFVHCHAFAMFGLMLFGGKVRPTNASLHESVYASLGYFANNFNDLPSAHMTLFELLVVNNWHVIVEGHVLACDSNKWVRWYFIAFYFSGVVFYLNVLMAVVLNTFLKESQRKGVVVVSTT